MAITGIVLGLALASPSYLVLAPPTAETPPPLSSPALTAPALTRPAPEPAGPVLVVPGMSRRRSSVPTVEAIPRREISPVDPMSGNDLPPLIGPGGVEVHSPPSPRPGLEDLKEMPPIVLESIPVSDGPSRDRETKPKRPTPSPDDEKLARPSPARRPPGIFGRLFPTPPPRGNTRAGNGLIVESRDDPAADAALKRRVERTLKDNLASRLRSYDVRVVDRDVTISARAARFWQKRAARNAIESLPALSGLNVKVEMLD